MARSFAERIRGASDSGSNRGDVLEQDAFLAHRPGMEEEEKEESGHVGPGVEDAPAVTRESPEGAVRGSGTPRGDAVMPIGSGLLSQLPPQSTRRNPMDRANAYAGRLIARAGGALRSDMANGGFARTVGFQVGLEASKPLGVPLQAVDTVRGLGVAATVAGRRLVKNSGEQPTDVAVSEREEYARTAEAGRAHRAALRGEQADPTTMPSNRAGRVATHGLRARGLASDVGEERAGLPAVRRRNRLANFFDLRRLAQNARGWWRDAAAVPRVLGMVGSAIGRLFGRRRRERDARPSADMASNPIINPPQAGGRVPESAGVPGEASLDDGPLVVPDPPRREDFTGMNDDDEYFEAAHSQWRERYGPRPSEPPVGSPIRQSDIFDIDDGQSEGSLDGSLDGQDGSLDGYQGEGAQPRTHPDSGQGAGPTPFDLPGARARLDRDYRYDRHELGPAQSALRIGAAVGREISGLGPYSPITGAAGSSIARHWISAQPERRDNSRPDLTTGQWAAAFAHDPDATRRMRRRQEAHAMRNSPALRSYMEQWNARRAQQGKQLLGPGVDAQDVDEYRSGLANSAAYQAPEAPVGIEPAPGRLRGFGFRNAVLAHRAALRLGTRMGYEGHRPEFEYTMSESAKVENMNAVREADPRMQRGEDVTPTIKADGTRETQDEAQERWRRQNAKAVRFVRDDPGASEAGEAPIRQTRGQRMWGRAAQVGAALPRGIDAFGQVLANEDTGVDDLDKGNYGRALAKATLSTARNVGVTTAGVGLAGATPALTYATFPIVDGVLRAGGGLVSGVGRTFGQVSGLERSARRQERIDHYNRHWFGPRRFWPQSPPRQDSEGE